MPPMITGARYKGSISSAPLRDTSFCEKSMHRDMTLEYLTANSSIDLWLLAPEDFTSIATIFALTLSASRKSTS